MGLRDFLTFGQRKKPAHERVKYSPVSVPTPHYVIGDIHGRIDLLDRMMTRIEADARTRGFGDGYHLVFLGDYVDRGENSAEVLDFLQSLVRERPETVTCLKGNHEVMLLQFLRDGKQASWLQYGGLQTLASYGVRNIVANAAEADIKIAREKLSKAIGPETHEWLTRLPLLYQSGNVVCVHAAVDPRLSIPEQSERTLLWGHPDFAHSNRTDGLWIAHGHTIVDTPVVSAGRISLDTGAYATGRLTCCGLDQSESWLLSA